MSATNRSSSPPNHVMSGGTPATSSQHAAHDDRLHFLQRQSPHDLVRAIVSDHTFTASSQNIEQPRSRTESSHSSRPSSSSPSSSLQHQSSSLSLNSQQGLSENFGLMNSESTDEQALLKSRSRMRELSTPLPSVPPSTPASTISHRSSFSQTQHNFPIHSPSFLRHGSPVFCSPLTEISDSEEVEAELSDSNSVEIISGYVSDPFVIGRYKDIGSSIQHVTQTVKQSFSNAPSPSLLLDNSIAVTSASAQLAPILSSSSRVALSAPLTPAQHPLSQSSSSTGCTNENEMKSTTVASDGSFVVPFHSTTMSPSRAQPRPGAKIENRLSSETSSPVPARDPEAEKTSSETQRVPEIKASQDSEDVLRTPNVYINGLPPHFPDESLYLMTREFGHVLSVRTFTRCVGEKMSGYGFVLFESVESAGNCIDALRKYRNLHPSFSKQVHKIPGTPYASGTITLPPAGSLASLASQSSVSTLSSFPSMTSTLVSSSNLSPLNGTSSPIKQFGHRIGESVSTISSSEFNGKDLRDLSFREKMEKLKDERSTNLYMEGLPLTIDDVSLAALVSPHKVVSSRFFQTKLSNPPRMIAFVRLDTRAGAEEVIDRLHGRVVRGWNDNGCRISVRFADTNEQRELRRQERVYRGEEEGIVNGPQLSMAHAALLNLRGAEAQAQLGNTLHLTNYDLRPPVTLPNPQLVSATHVSSDFGNINSFPKLNVGQSNPYGHSGVLSALPNMAQNSRQLSPLQHHSLRTVPLRSSVSATSLLDSHVRTAGASSNSQRNASMGAHTSFDGSGFPANSLNDSQLILLQQQNQLHQLQILRRMQDAGINTNYAFDGHGLEQSHSLMPSVDIMTNEIRESAAHVSESHISSHQGTNSHQSSALHSQLRGRSFSKGRMSEYSGSAQLGSATEHYIRHDGGNNQFPTQHQQQYSVNKTPISPASGYSSHFTGSGPNRNDIINNLDHRRGAAFEEGEVAVISPALTYASRTPSTLSPATPLFNTFGTPAPVPATVPRGKTNVRERDHSRLFRNELRQ